MTINYVYYYHLLNSSHNQRKEVEWTIMPQK